MSTSLLPSAAPNAWFNVVQWTNEAGGFAPWRVTPELVATARNPHFTNRVRAAAGVRAEVITGARELLIDLVRANPQAQEPLTVDVVFEGNLIERFVLDQQSSAAKRARLHRVSLPGRPGRLEVWLPHESGVILNELRLRGNSDWQEVPARPRWLTYGSSITHCIEAAGPSQTWPALVARNLGLELYGLGLAAQCHLDYAIERTIAQEDLDFLSLCLGINIYGRGSFDERALPGAVHGFIARSQQAHPNIPIVVISPLASPPAEETENTAGLTLTRIREIVRDVAQEFPSKSVTYLDGRQIISDAEVGAQLRSDQLHPHAEGYRYMARKLTPQLAAAFRRIGAQAALEVGQ